MSNWVVFMNDGLQERTTFNGGHVHSSQKSEIGALFLCDFIDELQIGPELCVDYFLIPFEHVLEGLDPGHQSLEFLHAAVRQDKGQEINT